MKQVLLKTGMVDGVMLYAPGSVDVSVDGTKILFHPNLNVGWFRTGTRVRGMYAAELTYSDGGGGVGSHFERLTSISFSVYHVEDLLLYSFTRRVSSTPIIACAHAIFSNEEVLRTVDVLVGSTLYAVDDLEPPIQSV